MNFLKREDFGAVSLKKETLELEKATKTAVDVVELGADDLMEMWDNVDRVKVKPEGDSKEVEVIEGKSFVKSLIAFACRDQKGDRIFSNDDISNLGKLIKPSWFNKISLKAKELNGFLGDEGKN